jgi:hypothetical protein
VCCRGVFITWCYVASLLSFDRDLLLLKRRTRLRLGVLLIYTKAATKPDTLQPVDVQQNNIFSPQETWKNNVST